MAVEVAVSWGNNQQTSVKLMFDVARRENDEIAFYLFGGALYAKDPSEGTLVSWLTVDKAFHWPNGAGGFGYGVLLKPVLEQPTISASLSG